MAKLVKLEFFRSEAGLLAYREYDDGSQRAGRVTDEEAEALTEELTKANGLGQVLMPTDMIKGDEDE